MKQTLYIDMDGVMVDFQSGIDHIVNTNKRIMERDGMMVYRQYTGRWDESPDIFRLMQPMPGAIEAFKRLSQHYDTYILSTAPWNNPNAWMHKVEWVQKHLGEEAHKRLILSHHKNLMRGDYLIDDRTANGAGGFEGQHIHFGSKEFPDWDAVLKYMVPTHSMSG